MNKINQLTSQYKFGEVYELCKNSKEEFALLSLANIYSSICQQEKALELYKKLNHIHYTITTMYYIESDLLKVKELTENYVNKVNEPLEHPKNEKIRIGYLGNTFNNPNHPVTRFIFNILRFHTDKFEVYCYQIGKQFNLPIQVNNKSFIKPSLEVTKEIRKDKLNILIELINHTSEDVLLLQYGKLAPIQISYCASPATTGMKDIDYKLMDEISVPKELENCFTEKILRLPRGFHTYCSDNYKIEPIEHKGIHFCCFNNPLKITKATIELWVRLLGKVSDSKIFLQYHYYQSKFIQNKISEIFKQTIVALKLRIDITDRLFFVGLLENKNEILKLYNFMDISLDTYPYNGTTITCESLFMNVPNFTRISRKLPQGRIGASLLKSINCEECIIDSELKDEYIETVKEYCNVDKLRELKEKIKRNLKTSVLGNPKMFMNDYEYCIQKLFV